jgi:predicted permease
MLSDLRYRLRALFHRDAMDSELDDELRFHLESETEKYVRAGLSREAAERAARLAFGSVDAAAETSRDGRGWSTVDSLSQDIRFALRTLGRNRGFTMAAILVLSLGIAGTTAVVSLADAVLLRPVPGVGAPDRLVYMQRVQGSGSYDNFGYPDYLDVRDRAKSLEDVAAFIGVPVSVPTPDGRTRRFRAQLVSGNFFSTLRVTPAIGRLLDEGDDEKRSPVVVLSYRHWLRDYGGDRAIVGRALRISGHSFTVVGVTSPEFTGPGIGQSFDLWAPLSTQPQLLSRMSAGIMTDRSAGWLQMIARLKNGATLAQAVQELRLIASQLAAAYPATNEGRTIVARAGIGLDASERSSLGRTFGLLMLAVGLVMLAACANVAGLLLVRGLKRRREIAARLAIGATKIRLVRQLLVEGLVLAIIAGAIGISVAAFLAGAAAALQPTGSVLRGITVTLDARMILIALGATVASAMLFAILPAIRASSLEPAAVLRDASTGGARHRAMQRVLIGAQVAFAFALLVTAAVVTLSMRDILNRPTGFDTDGIVMMNVDLSAEGYREDQGLPFYRRLLAELAEERSIESASFAKTVPPLDWSDRVSIFEPGKEPPPDVLHAQSLTIGYRVRADGIAPSYMKTMGIRLLAGREFTIRDDASAPGVIVVNEAFARDYFGTANPIGRRVSWPPWDGPPLPPVEVVGVVADHQYTSLLGAPEPLMYFPVLQRYDGRATIVARVRGGETATLQAIERAVRDADPRVATTSPMTMRSRMADTVWQQRLLATWLAAFGALGLTMSIVGLYAVIAQSVAQRTRELSLRLALGAPAPRLRGAVILEGIVLALLGVAAGIPLAIAAMRVSSSDGTMPAAWMFSLVVVVIATVAATYLPARRVARLNPAEALKDA